MLFFFVTVGVLNRLNLALTVNVWCCTMYQKYLALEFDSHKSRVCVIWWLMGLSPQA